ncbi:uncharacterized protein TRAVEDRAFT_31394 [Trametes versicolor FP-101664 SS1]|uniref:uncharacterized protein n=1 Tax=Trametes versicolor (strain FP-101664) TaxID=717944 RepID=UPI0004622884|nr:uncharacterized protein TRAVEDRAFT_31394 [Trametes versicolor FP-101664 SS1]EIW54503.1 hypothetical protein TRAVEDRAFT_31394 [Trametes versicolor FP-101664 SS1]
MSGERAKAGVGMPEKLPSRSESWLDERAHSTFESYHCMLWSMKGHIGLLRCS